MSTESLTVTSTSSQSSAVPSTKVRVVTDSDAVFYAVGASPVAFTTGNCEIVGAGQVRYINMQGLNNKIAFIVASGTANVSVTPIGTVNAITIVSGSDKYIPS